MKKIEEYVTSIPDFPEAGNYFQRYYQCDRRSGWIEAGDRFIRWSA